MKIINKFFSLIMSVAMLLTLLPMVQPVAMAAETDVTDSVNVYVTVALQGDGESGLTFAKTRDGSFMAAKAVQITDQNSDGELTIYDVLVCAHNQLAPSGANDFVVASGSKGTVTAKKYGAARIVLPYFSLSRQTPPIFKKI